MARGADGFENDKQFEFEITRIHSSDNPPADLLGNGAFPMIYRRPYITYSNKEFRKRAADG